MSPKKKWIDLDESSSHNPQRQPTALTPQAGSLYNVAGATASTSSEVPILCTALKSAQGVLSEILDYTITVSAPQCERHITCSAHLELQEICQGFDETKLIHPKDILPDVPLSRTESHLPSLYDTRDDSGNCEASRVVGTSVIIKGLLYEADSETRCEAIDRVIQKSASDVDWSQSLACDFSTLGNIVLWIRHQIVIGFSLLSSTSKPFSLETSANEKPTVVPAEALACASAMILLLLRILPLDRKCSRHLLQAGLHEALFFRVDEMHLLVSVAQIIQPFKDWRNAEIGALPRRIVLLLNNLCAGSTAPQTLWEHFGTPQVLSGIATLLPEDSTALFMLLHTLTVNLSDATIFSFLTNSSGIHTLFSFFEIAALNSTRTATEQGEKSQWDLDEWVLIFCSKFLQRKNGDMFPWLIEEFLSLQFSVAEACLVDTETDAESGDVRPSTLQLSYFCGSCKSVDLPDRKIVTSATPESSNVVITYMFRILEEILDFEQRRRSRLQNNGSAAALTAENATFDVNLLSQSIHSAAFQDMFVYIMSQYHMHRTSAHLGGDKELQALRYRVGARGLHLFNDFLNSDVSGDGGPVKLSWSIFRQTFTVLNIVTANVTAFPLTLNRKKVSVGLRRDFFLHCGIYLLDLCVTLLKDALNKDNRVTELRDASVNNNMEFFMSRRDILMTCASLLYENRDAQDRIAESSGLNSILRHAAIDKDEYGVREAALFALRNALTGHHGNSEVVKILLNCDQRFDIVLKH